MDKFNGDRVARPTPDALVADPAAVAAKPWRLKNPKNCG